VQFAALGHLHHDLITQNLPHTQRKGLAHIATVGQQAFDLPQTDLPWLIAGKTPLIAPSVAVPAIACGRIWQRTRAPRRTPQTNPLWWASCSRRPLCSKGKIPSNFSRLISLSYCFLILVFSGHSDRS